ncbi:fatty acid synthase-like isoform X1 [Cydia strobilella]|uniref:fatty acid synthase-like isoform X1 n=1 Tax=Cydia strobilella TaxID=1100964 RepID=UPI0030058047
MVPSPQEQQPETAVGTTMDKNRVVISGISGLYPQSHHIKDLTDILYKKENPVTAGEPRWKFDHPEVPPFVGTVPKIDCFDAQFFKVHYRLSSSMDPMGRKILEQAYQAIYDSGVSPEHLSGKKIGVFIGSCFSETEKAAFYVASSRTGFGIAGCNKSMFANRVSYWLNAKGPSQSIDAACCSSTVALEQAYLAMTRGDCEAAIVGGSNLCLHPQSSMHHGRIISLCKDGKTKSYDQNADGCARSEAVNVLFLQKAKDALRIYADVVHVKNKFLEIVETDTGPKYGFYRDPVSMSGFLKEFYEEAKILPNEVEYIEGFGSGDAEADKVELEAFDEVFCRNRSEPLVVGSVMSNLGYCEAASGITAITKVLLGYHKGEIAGNLHCTTPRNDVEAIQKGRMRILTDHQHFKRTYVGVNGMSVTGINSHVLLHGHFKPKDPTRYQCSFPRLVTISARQDVAVKSIIDDLKSRSIDPEELALLHNIHSSRISGHVGRGFVILGTDKDNKTVCLCEKASYCDASDRPLWFVYSGMGSQWTGMGKALMRIPIFSDAIERCRKVLEPKGVDIIHIITSPDKSIYDNILNSFVGIAAIQIGLTDILHELGLIPNKIIGHSVGELGCAYADGCLTAEEMILSAYSRGLVSVQTPFIHGSMAAVGIGFDKVSKMCPPEIEVACHNGPDSCTISGPAVAMSEFVAQLTAKGIFAKDVPCSNIAYHSRYIAEAVIIAGPALRKYLTEVISTPKLRSPRWVSTSVPQERWNEEAAKYSSAEYHTNNLLNPVLFEETSRLIPQNAVLVEVAPHGLLQAILKRSLPSSCVNVPLTRRGHSDNAQVLLEAIGQLYMEGYYPNIRVLYPKIDFPVSTGTPHLSHLVEWAHNETWFLPLYVSASRREAAACNFVISLHDSENNYLQGHVIQGKTVYPFAGALVAVWDTLAMSLGVARKQLSVQFRDVHLFAQPLMHDSRQLRLSVSLNRGTGLFEVTDDSSKVATGYVNRVSSNISTGFKHHEKTTEVLELTTDDVYKILFQRHYRYAGEFRSICSTNSTFAEGYLLWKGNWVTLIDGMLQLNVLRQPHEGISQPAYIRKITIDIKRHLNKKNVQINDLNVMKTNICAVQDSTSCEGILLEGIRFREIVPADEKKLALKALNFVPRFQSVRDLKVQHIFQVFIQIVSENIGKDIINVVEIYDKRGDDYVFQEINTTLKDIPGIAVNMSHMHKSEVLDNVVKEADLVLVSNLSRDDNLCQTVYRLFHRNGFLINAEHLEETSRPSALYSVVSEHSSKKTRLELVKWRPITLTSGTSTFTVRTTSDLALLQTARTNLPLRQRMIVLTPYPMISGLKDLVKQWRSESERNQIFLLTFKNTSENLHIDTLPELDLAFNIINHDEWGGEYYEPLQQKVGSNCGIALKSAKIGDLESLRWIETAGCKGFGVPVKVHFAGLNINDAKRAYGEIPFEVNNTSESYYGMDFSGMTETGQRVMGVVRGGAVSDRVLAYPELMWPVPDHWSLEDAATVPLPYAHAFYCLFIKSKLKQGSSIVVHGGSGALGQAIICITLHMKCEVFVAVSDIKKKQYLQKLYPQLKEDHIGCSRDKNFSDLVLSHTKGRGCSVVITCGQGEIKTAFLKCCAPEGITLDTSPLKSQENYMFRMSYIAGDRSYMSIDFASIFESPNKDEWKKLQVMVAKGIQDGYVRPLSRVSFMPEEATRAFRLLAASGHRGRILLRLQPALPQPECPRLFCSSDHCQMLISDEEGLAIQLGDRLIKSGARTLHLHLPAPPSSHLLKTWETLGVKIQISTEELTSSKDIINLLSESWRIGPVEGIFVLITKALNKQQQKMYETLVDNLDIAARKTCPTMKYFAVVGINNIVGQRVCLSRASQRLPAMMLQIPQELSDSRQITNAVEQGLCSQQSDIFAHTQVTTSNKTLIDQIAAISGIPISIDTVGGDGSVATLQDLGISSEKARAVSIFLRDTYYVCIDDDKIPYITVEKLRDIEEMSKECEYPPKEGLGALFTYVDPDELLATVELMSPPTHSHSSQLREDELDNQSTLPVLCVIPGLEGHHHRYRLMCERLKLQAFVLQPGLDKPGESNEKLAARYVKIMLKKINKNKRFYLLGYEMGVLTALEMAAILEDQGMTGTVFCLGGGPEDFLAALEEQINTACAGEDSEQVLQNAVARHMCALMGSASTQLETALRNASTWREKVDVSVSVLRGRVTYSAQYAQALIEAAYARVTQARNARARVQATPRALQSRVVLLRSPTAVSASPHPLQRYTRLPLAIHDLSAPLAHATDDLRVAAIVNQYLDDEVLQEFENRNLCTSYLLNADVFMTA